MYSRKEDFKDGAIVSGVGDPLAAVSLKMMYNPQEMFQNFGRVAKIAIGTAGGKGAMRSIGKNLAFLAVTAGELRTNKASDLQATMQFNECFLTKGGLFYRQLFGKEGPIACGAMDAFARIDSAATYLLWDSALVSNITLKPPTGALNIGLNALGAKTTYTAMQRAKLKIIAQQKPWQQMLRNPEALLASVANEAMQVVCSQGRHYLPEESWWQIANNPDVFKRHDAKYASLPTALQHRFQEVMAAYALTEQMQNFELYGGPSRARIADLKGALKRTLMAYAIASEALTGIPLGGMNDRLSWDITGVIQPRVADSKQAADADAPQPSSIEAIKALLINSKVLTKSQRGAPYQYTNNKEGQSPLIASKTLHSLMKQVVQDYQKADRALKLIDAQYTLVAEVESALSDRAAATIQRVSRGMVVRRTRKAHAATIDSSEQRSHFLDSRSEGSIGKEPTDQGYESGASFSSEDSVSTVSSIESWGDGRKESLSPKTVMHDFSVSGAHVPTLASPVKDLTAQQAQQSKVLSEGQARLAQLQQQSMGLQQTIADIDAAVKVQKGALTKATKKLHAHDSRPILLQAKGQLTTWMAAAQQHRASGMFHRGTKKAVSEVNKVLSALEGVTISSAADLSSVKAQLALAGQSVAKHGPWKTRKTQTENPQLTQLITTINALNDTNFKVYHAAGSEIQRCQQKITTLEAEMRQCEHAHADTSSQIVKQQGVVDLQADKMAKLQSALAKEEQAVQLQRQQQAAIKLQRVLRARKRTAFVATTQTTTADNKPAKIPSVLNDSIVREAQPKSSPIARNRRLAARIAFTLGITLMGVGAVLLLVHLAVPALAVGVAIGVTLLATMFGNWLVSKSTSFGFTAGVGLACAGAGMIFLPIISPTLAAAAIVLPIAAGISLLFGLVTHTLAKNSATAVRLPNTMSCEGAGTKATSLNAQTLEAGKEDHHEGTTGALQRVGNETQESMRL